MAVGLLRPDSGTVRVEDYDVVSHTREAARLLGYVPDQPFLYDKLTGREFLEFAGRMRGLDRATVADRIARETDVFELGEFIDNLTETYSHGMKQRTVFASVLLHNPRVLVIDEPMVGLDPRSVRLVKDLLRSLSTAGTCIFMSTHTLSVAEEIADRIGIINGGKLHFLGTVAELQAELASPHRSLEPLFLELTEGKNGQPADRSSYRTSRASQP
jgi:ABC-2 type transport system ATP-binding protein